MGLLAGYFAFKSGGSQHLRLFLTTGILGGYTTFSTFSLDAVLMWERDKTVEAVGYAAASFAISIAGLWIGLMIARRFF